MTEPIPAKLLTHLRNASQGEADRLIRTLEGELLVLEENPPEGRQDEVKRLALIVRRGRQFLERRFPPTEPPPMDAILDRIKERIE